MNRYFNLLLVCFFVGCTSPRVEYSDIEIDAPSEPNENMTEELKRLVEAKRESAKLVGLGAIVIQDGNIIGLAVSGERKKGSDSYITPNDKWHIGSITKSFTSTMIARLIEKGELSWNTTIEDVFPDENKIHSMWKNVTLRNLLTHTSGAKPNFSILVRLKNPDAGIDRITARESAVRNILARRPKTTPDTAFVYSNVGYTIAGVMAEKKTGISWEDLIVREVFSPLGIKSGGFGAPKDKVGKLSQPWGHRNIFGFTVSSRGDNSSIMGPAGTIHISLNDLAQYGVEHLNGIKGKGSILTSDSYKHLHTPKLNNYAYGWVIGAPQELNVGNVHWHNGSNTMWYSLLVILPDINTVIGMASNDGKIQVADQTFWEIIEHLVKPLSAAHNKSVNSDAVNSAGY